MSFWSDFLTALRRRPKPAPKPAPKPQPQPAPKPTPAPVPAPKPAPKPVPAPAPAPAPQAKREAWLFLPIEWIKKARQPASFWGDLGFTGVVATAHDAGHTSPFDPQFDPAALIAHVGELRAAVGSLDVYLAHWCTNAYGPTKFLHAWDDDARWTQFSANLRVWSAAAVSIGARGVLMDAEWYPVVGTYQDPAIVWTAHPRIPERGAQWATALTSAGPLTLGHFVTYRIEDPLAGYAPFWRAVSAAAPGSVMLADDGFLAMDSAHYGQLRSTIRATLGCETLAGVGIWPDPARGGRFLSDVLLARAASPAGLWVYPWQYDVFAGGLADPTVDLLRKGLHQ